MPPCRHGVSLTEALARLDEGSYDDKGSDESDWATHMVACIAEALDADFDDPDVYASLCFDWNDFRSRDIWLTQHGLSKIYIRRKTATGKYNMEIDYAFEDYGASWNRTDGLLISH